MKQLQFLSLLGLFSILIYSCDTIPCDGVDCGEHGTCNESDGTCICTTGYVWNDSASTCLLHCLVEPCPPNSTCNTISEVCECDSGYIMIPNGLCIDLCAAVNCGLNGDCDFNTGECICDPGYGPGNLSPCEAFNLKFAGQWMGSHTDDFGTTTGPYTMNLIADQNDPTFVRFDNFVNYGCSSQPALSVLGYVAADGMGIHDFESLCGDWQTDGVFDQALLINSGQTLQLNVFITSGGSGFNLSGTYTRQ